MSTQPQSLVWDGQPDHEPREGQVWFDPTDNSFIGPRRIVDSHIEFGPRRCYDAHPTSTGGKGMEERLVILELDLKGLAKFTERRLLALESQPVLSVPAEGGEYQRGRSDERIEQFKALQKFGGWTSLTDRAEAWSKVCEVLDEVSPDWGITPGEGSGIDKAVAAIRALSTEGNARG